MRKSLALLFCLFIVLACGGGGDSGGGGPTTGTNNGVNMNVNRADLSFGQTLLISGTVVGESSNTLLYTTNGGTIDQISSTDAIFTAPNQAGTFTVTARSAVNSGKYGTVVIVVSQVGISIEPSKVTVGPGSVTTFTATVTGTANTGATFSASGGSVQQTGSSAAKWTAPSTTGAYTITAKANANSNVTATANITVANVGSNAIVTGRVVQDGTTTGISGIQVAFYNSGGSELARTTTTVNGTFSTNVPTSAKRFHLVNSSIGSNWYKQYTYGSLRYSTLIESCTAPLPTLSAGQTSPLSSDIELQSTNDSPPPPPNGCAP